MLADLGRADLVERWRRLYRREPPKGMSRPLLIRAVAYAMQVKHQGGLRPATRQRLQKLAAGGTEQRNNRTRIPSTATPGMRLVREWNGVSHVVEAVEGGFIWKGAHYRSLSAVARAITAARWSGPRFFGLASDDAS